jgi:A/G-specific adenine glycosylase
VRSRSPDFRILGRKIVSWFAANARDLPWRRTRDPYAVWISEVMLQQTQVKTVIPYWERWMKLFPDVEALAKAGEEKVLKAWEGLGYYSRARNLQKAARKIVLENRGEFPRAFRDVLDLPGIGRYTAGAICSIAFGEKTPILDGNVARVLARLFLISGSMKERQTLDELWHLSTKLVENSTNSSGLNQGLMELGATVCLPRQPHCPECPLKSECRARLTRRVEEFPNRKEKQTMRQRQFVAMIVQKNGSVLVRKRAADLVNAGLWEFPNLEIPLGDDAKEAVLRFGLECEPLATIKHTITTNRITLRAFAGRANGKSMALAKMFEAKWHSISDLHVLPFSSAHARLREVIQGGGGSRNKGAVA